MQRSIHRWMRAGLLGAMALVATACDEAVREGGVPAARVLLDEGDPIGQPVLSPDGMRVAYWVRADTGTVATLMIANADFTAPKATTLTSLFNSVLMWSPDGTHLVSSQNTAVVVLDIAADTIRRYESSGGIIEVVDWAPSGDRLAALETAAGGSYRTSEIDLATGAMRALIPGERRPHFAVYLRDRPGLLVNLLDQGKLTMALVDSIGGPLRALTSEGFESIPVAQPLPVRNAISPDGTELLYLSLRTGRPDLWTVPLAGGAPRQLTQDVRGDFSALWTPDGSRIAFLSERGGQTDIWMISRAGGEAWRLTDSPEIESLLGWRGGSDTLVFQTSDLRSGLVVASVRDGAERELVADSLRVRPSWALSPDGTLVAAPLIGGGGVDVLLLAEVATGTVRARVPVGGCVCDLAWSPDGRTLALSSDRGGSRDIWTLGVGDTSFVRLTDWTTSEFTPVFSADGRTILFSADRDAQLGDVWRVPVSGGEAERLTTAGNILDLVARPPHAIFARSIRPSDGAFTAVRLFDDGRTTPLWRGRGQSQTDGFMRGDSVVISVLGTGTPSTHLVPIAGGEGRLLIVGGEYPLDISADGRQMLIRFDAGANKDLGLIDLDTGTRTTLTRTPLASEFGAEFAADPDQVVIRRQRDRVRFLAVPLPKTP